MCKEYKMDIRTNDNTAYCRGCQKTLKRKLAVIIEPEWYWRNKDGLVLCADCVQKMTKELDEFMKELSDDNVN